MAYSQNRVSPSHHAILFSDFSINPPSGSAILGNPPYDWPSFTVSWVLLGWDGGRWPWWSVLGPRVLGPASAPSPLATELPRISKFRPWRETEIWWLKKKPLRNMTSSVGMMKLSESPNRWKKNTVPNHQPVFVHALTAGWNGLKLNLRPPNKAFHKWGVPQ